MRALRITHWDESHETYESSKLKFLNWVASPNKHDGLGFAYLRAQEDRTELYCAFALMVQLASKAPKGIRGWLVRDNKRLEPKDMALMTGFPVEIFVKAEAFFQRPEIGWLMEEEMPAQTPYLPARHAGTPAGRNANTRNRNISHLPPDSAGTPADGAAPTASDAGISPTGREGGSTDREYREYKTGREGRARARGSVPTLEEVLEIAADLSEGLPDQEKIGPDYATYYWRKKQEQPNTWWQRNGELIDVPQQLFNWWQDDRAEWNAKKLKKTGGRNGVDIHDLQTALQNEPDAEKRRELRERIRQAEAA
jgi:hypothetical protein